MAFRFQRRIRILPGVRVNVSKSGFGLSVGPRGYSTSTGPRGVYRSTGIPGTGLSYREKIEGTPGRAASGPPDGASDKVAVGIDSDGQVRFRRPDGSDAPASLVRRVREQNAEAIESLIAAGVVRFNADLTACLSIHRDTPAPAYRPMALVEPPPAEPEPPELFEIRFWDRVLFRRKRIEATNGELKAAHDRRIKRWSFAMQERQRLEAEFIAFNRQVEDGDPEAQARILESRLSEIAWAKPTDVAFDFGDDAGTLALDIDLPTIEELPEREALVPARGVNVRWKVRSAAQRRRDFAYVAHAALFRVVGEAFACLPRLREVTISGFTQRQDGATGHIVDTYILSARVRREDWTRIDFSRLDAVDVKQALGRFDLARDMTRSGDLRRIDPLGEESEGRASAANAGKTARQ